MATKNVNLKIVMFIVFMIVSSCSSSKIASTSDSYKILKIDSLKNSYIIYAIHKKQYFKIVSHKEIEYNHCKTIKVGKKYNLVLKSLFLNKQIVPLHLRGVDFYDEPIFIEDSIFDIHQAENLKGLCLIR